MSRNPAAPALSSWSKLAVIAILATAVLAGPGATAQEPPYPTTTSLSAPPSACDSEPVTLTATVASDYGLPTGTVDFYSDDAGYLGSANLDGGTASLDVSLAAGARSLSATYFGDADFDYSSSSEAGCTVNAAPAIDYGPESQYVDYLDSATLTVFATGAEPLSYFWYQYDEWGPPIPFGDDSPTYTTAPISTDLSFWVEVFNDCGSPSAAPPRSRWIARRWIHRTRSFRTGPSPGRSTSSTGISSARPPRTTSMNPSGPILRLSNTLRCTRSPPPTSTRLASTPSIITG